MLTLFLLTCGALLVVGQDEPQGSVHSGCNETISEGQGVITSSNFPELYNPNTNCYWQIRVEPDRTAVVEFTYFNVENSANCGYDSVQVYNGPTVTHPKLGTFCGPFRPNRVLSTSNQLLLTFKSDESTQKTGFVALFYSIQLQRAEPNSCGGLLTEDEGGFHSVDFPKSNYPNGMTCVWHIRTSPDRRVVLRFGKMTLESSENCRFDAVTVLGGSTEADGSRFLGRFCQRSAIPDDIESPGNEMYVTFSSDSSGSEIGFDATYATKVARSRSVTPVTTARPIVEERVCPDLQTLTSPGSITSPGYKTVGGYPNLINCGWRIVAPRGHRIRLRIVNFDLEADKTGACLYDYVVIHDGRELTSNLLMNKTCGSIPSRYVTSSGNEMSIRMVTDGSGNADGFRFTYQFISPTTTTTTTERTTTTIAPTTTTAAATTTSASSSVCTSDCIHNEDLATSICSMSHALLLKVVRIRNRPDGGVRVLTVVVKSFKSGSLTVRTNKKAKLWLEVPCPDCFVPLTRKSRYLVMGSMATSRGAQLNEGDFVAKLKRNLLRTAKKSLRRCRRVRRHGRKKRKNRRGKHARHPSV
ncbi:tolloid-like protein 1 [Ciona intestinalis]